MKPNHLLLVVVLFFFAGTAAAQKTSSKKSGLLSYNINLSDYGALKKTGIDSGQNAPKQNIFETGNQSIGFGVSYWKGLTSHIDFAGTLSGTFSNFPSNFVKNDSIGNAGFSTQADAMIHIRALKENASFNPFIAGGIGAGNFGAGISAYAPVGAGLQVRFSPTSFMVVQGQWRMALTDAIKNDYLFYSIGFAQHGSINQLTKVAKNKKSLKAQADKKKSIPALKDKNIDKPVPAVEKDTDGDGVIDSKDACPDVKGTVNGCPDMDKDGIADKDDKCPNVAGSAKYNGCPVPDTDGDGINDDEDGCINEPGVKQNHGCPLPDYDKDGVPDEDDRCPDIAGTVENKGCPLPYLEGGELLKVSSDTMTYKVGFDFDRSNLTPDAFGLMQQIVQLMKKDKSFRISIAGHADNLGIEKANVQISADRANITRDYFLSYQIAPSRVITNYYGSSRPIDKNQQWRNRRVEISVFRIR